MPDKYEQLLERSIIVQEGLQRNLEGLRDNTKALNDNFALHCQGTVKIVDGIKDIRGELMRWLKWVVSILLAVLLTLAGLKQLINFIQ